MSDGTTVSEQFFKSPLYSLHKYAHPKLENSLEIDKRKKTT